MKIIFQLSIRIVILHFTTFFSHNQSANVGFSFFLLDVFRMFGSPEVDRYYFNLISVKCCCYFKHLLVYIYKDAG